MAVALPLPWVVDRLAGGGVVCWEVDRGFGWGLSVSSFWLLRYFSKSVRMSWWLLRVQDQAILYARLLVRPFAGLTVSGGGEVVKDSYVWVCEEFVVVLAQEASLVWCDVEFNLV